MKNKIIFSNFDDIKNPNYGGGGAIAIHEVAKRLAKKYSIIILTGKYAGYKNEIIDNILYKRIGLFYQHPKFAQITFQLLLPFYVIFESYDLWFESFTPPFSTGLLQLFTRKPVVGITHFLSAEEKSKEYKLPFHLIQNNGLRTYKNIIALSDEIKNKIIKIAKNVKVTIISNGVTPQKQVSDKTANYILFIGRLEVYQKGIDLLLRAFKIASTKIHTNLYIAGSGQPKDIAYIKKAITELRLNKRVKLLGQIEGERKNKIYSLARFTVVPSRYEAFSLVALESLAFAKPIISFDISGLNWIDTKSSLKAKSFSTDSLADCIVHLDTDEKLRISMQRNCLKLSAKYSWSRVAVKYDQFIKTILHT